MRIQQIGMVEAEILPLSEILPVHMSLNGALLMLLYMVLYGPCVGDRTADSCHLRVPMSENVINVSQSLL